MQLQNRNKRRVKSFLWFSMASVKLVLMVALFERTLMVNGAVFQTMLLEKSKSCRIVDADSSW